MYTAIINMRSTATINAWPWWMISWTPIRRLRSRTTMSWTWWWFSDCSDVTTSETTLLAWDTLRRFSSSIPKVLLAPVRKWTPGKTPETLELQLGRAVINAIDVPVAVFPGLTGNDGLAPSEPDCWFWGQRRQRCSSLPHLLHFMIWPFLSFGFLRPNPPPFPELFPFPPAKAPGGRKDAYDLR